MTTAAPARRPTFGLLQRYCVAAERLPDERAGGTTSVGPRAGGVVRRSWRGRLGRSGGRAAAPRADRAHPPRGLAAAAPLCRSRARCARAVDPREGHPAAITGAVADRAGDRFRADCRRTAVASRT